MGNSIVSAALWWDLRYKPTEPCLAWYRADRDEQPGVIRITREGDGRLFVEFLGEEGGQYLDSLNGDFAWPLLPPEIEYT